MQNYTFTGIRLTEDMKERIRILAFLKHLSQSQLMREALDEYLKKERASVDRESVLQTQKEHQ